MAPRKVGRAAQLGHPPPTPPIEELPQEPIRQEPNAAEYMRLLHRVDVGHILIPFWGSGDFWRSYWVVHGVGSKAVH